MIDDTVVTTTDMAEIADVTVQCITNWKSRYDDFPAPVEIHRRTTVYDRNEFREWLRTHHTRKIR